MVQTSVYTCNNVNLDLLPIILDDPRVICVAIFSLHICLYVLAPHVVIFV